MSTRPSISTEEFVQKLAAFMEVMKEPLIAAIAEVMDRLGPHEIAGVISDGSQPQFLESSQAWPYGSGVKVVSRDELIKVVLELRFTNEALGRQVPTWLAELRSHPEKGLRIPQFVVYNGVLVMVPFTLSEKPVRKVHGQA